VEVLPPLVREDDGRTVIWVVAFTAGRREGCWVALPRVMLVLVLGLGLGFWVMVVFIDDLRVGCCVDILSVLTVNC
jgi:hypothetical protein